MKRSLNIGINEYPQGSSLSGCVNDALDWVELLSGLDYETYILLDSQATVQRVTDRLAHLIDISKAGDSLVITYSGHGSYLKDTDGDESDGRDETLYLVDGHLTDDVLRTLLNKVREGVHVAVILDCCHSGTGTRSGLIHDSETGDPLYVTIRYHEPGMIRSMRPQWGWFLGMLMKLLKKPVGNTTASVIEEIGEVVLTGCTSTEYSYDTSFKGRPNGAFTRLAIDAYKRLVNPTYTQWFNEIRKSLPSSDFPQTPQLEGRQSRKDSQVFA